MIPHVSRLPAALILALSLVLPAARASAQVADATLSIMPDTVTANKPATLTLLGAATSCNTTFARESVTVAGTRINLSYVARTLAYPVDTPAAKSILPCPVYDTLTLIRPSLIINLPTFQLPALKAGRYEVWATQMFECMYVKPACLVAPQPRLAGILTVRADGAIAYSISPGSAAADREFQLSLLSYQFTCAHTYDNLATAVDGNAITLTYLDHIRVGVACPAVYKPYGPTFTMPPLKPGTYKVKAYRLPACHPCKMMGEVADAGTLTISDTTLPRKGWFLKDKEVHAGQPFSMQLLNQAYGNCQTSFSHPSVTVSAGAISASFLVEKHPERVCITDIRPHGPVFGMQGLKLGMYPVYVTELMACEVSEPRCVVDRVRPYPVDTLIVMQTLSMRLSDLRARSPKADLQGSRAALILPEGIGGTWQAELLTPTGRRLATSSVKAEGGNRAEIDLGMKPDRGLYLLRLSAPDGETHMIPIIRKD